MLVLADDDAVPAGCRGAAVAIGNFDGVHRGHQALLEQTRRLAERRRAPAGLITFEPHPRSFFRPDDPVFRLSPLPLKARLAAGLGMDFVAAVTFDRRLANLEAEAFVETVMARRFAIRQLVTGPDFHFGHGRRGNTQTLERLGREFGFELSIHDQVTGEDGVSPFSSSGIRAALRHGNVTAAGRQLGYWWTLLGAVVEGDRRGRDIGFPTANLVLEPGVEPREGIYAARVRIERSAKAFEAAAYVGTRPTFATDRKFLEVHILDFDGNLYGQELMVDLVAYLRSDHAFEGAEALVRQMRLDCESARERLDALGREDPLLAFPLGRLQGQGRL